ncbi:DUF3761 domain-containing protein [Burkholderia pseudomallei]|uniref:DUF3761 domain-containing protein n=1 Tax=Burkholderia pseudomallei TaxID=28450 RepID=UPI0009B2C66B|nr:DUF3761 domain-containing protein [Burkholderia pseudomallei]
MTGISLSPGRVAAQVLAAVRRGSLLALLALAGTAHAYQPSSRDESQLKEHGHYVNHDGHVVHSPAHSRTGAMPVGATARCGDGTYSFSQHHSGTCSRHRGVAEWE